MPLVFAHSIMAAILHVKCDVGEWDGRMKTTQRMLEMDHSSTLTNF